MLQKSASRSASRKAIQTAPSAPFLNRLAKVRLDLTQRKLDGYLVLDRMDQIWLTGFTGEDGGVLVTHDEVALLTDGRFDEAADIEAPWARKIIRKKRTPDVTARELKRRKLNRVGFEPRHMNVYTFVELGKLARPIKLSAASGVIGDLRLIKDAEEIELIRAAIDIAERAFRQLQTWIRPGMTEREVAARLVYEMQQLGAQGPAFPPIVAAGANGSLPHYEAGDGVINQREPVLIDWGARRRWYVSDLTRVLALGTIRPPLSEAHKVVCAARDRAIAVIRPGVAARMVDRAAREHIARSGFGERFTHGLGHGIGLNVHERPSVRKITKDVLRPGMVITIEPGIYLPGVGGVRVEDDVLVTETGCEVLSTLPHEVRT